MIAEAVQAAQEAAKQGGNSTATAIGLGVLIVSNVGIWLDKIVAGWKERRAAKEAEAAAAKAEAEEAEAKLAEAQAAAAAAPKTNGNGKAAIELHEKYVLPHSLELQRLDGEVKATKASYEKLERENREDHEKIFKKLDDIRDLVIGKSSGAA